MKITQSFSRLLITATIASAGFLSTFGVARADLTMPYGTGLTSYSFQNVSTSSATVVANYYNQDGSPAYQHTYNSVGSLTRTDVALGNPDAALPPNWKGSVVLSSDQDVIAVAETDYTSKAANDSSTSVPGTETATYAAFNNGATTLYGPLISRIGRTSPTSGAANLATRLTIQNTTATPTSVYVNFNSPAGGAFGQVVRNLAAYGSVTLDTTIDADVPASFASAGGNASVVITATQPIVGVSENSSDNPFNGSNLSASYALLTSAGASTDLYSPQAFRLCAGLYTDCGFNLNPTHYGVYNSYQLQNTTGGDAHVTAYFIASNGNLAATIPFTIPAYAMFGINLFNGGGLNASSPLWAALGIAFTGSVHFHSDAPIVGVGNLTNALATTDYSSVFALVSAADATGTFYAPLFNRVCALAAAQCNNTTPIASWTKFSVLTIVNVDPVNQVTLTSIDALDASGAVVHSFTNSDLKTAAPSLVIPAGGSIGINASNGGAFTVASTQLLGTNFQGSVRVVGPVNAKLKAIVQVTNADVGSDMYNAMNR